MVDLAKILSNVEIAKDVYRMELETKLALDCKPGQFIEITVPGYYLRRPISISEIFEDKIVIVYKILGEGTKVMSEMKPGDILDIFGSLGNGFPVEERDSLLLIGGGVGVPPLLETAKRYRALGTKVDVVLGFNSACDAFYMDAFEKLGCNVAVATMDGTLGTKGTVMDAIREAGITTSYIMSCGPLPMLKALNNAYTEGYISLEARMACGMGACMGCVVKDQEGHSLRVCKDGPVFEVGRVAL